MYDSAFPTRGNSQDSLIEPADKPQDVTKAGSEQPTADENRSIENPKARKAVVDKEAYSKKKVLSIPTDKLFWGNTTRPKPQALRYLRMLADFMHRVRCRAIIGEIDPAHAADSSGSSDLSFERSWVLVKYLTEKSGIDSNRFSISVAGPAQQGLIGNRAVIRITLDSQDSY